MYIRRGREETEPPEIYRDPLRIRLDIERIKREIETTSEAVNIRGLLLEMLTDKRRGEPEKLIPELYFVIEEAEAALVSMNKLKEELLELEEELKRSVCRMKM